MRWWIGELHARNNLFYEIMAISNDAPNLQNEESKIPYKHCLNCGAELNGMFCYNCGQQATSKVPTVGGFILEYLNNAFIWDPKFFQTLWTLVRWPGRLTNEFLSGKFISQEHPLKLNMFLVFVFVTLFLFFSGTEKVGNSVHNLTTDDMVFPGLQIELLMDNSEYAKKIEVSPRDTVQISAPLFLADNYPTIIRNLETIEDTQGKALDKWNAELPQIFVEDRIVVPNAEGYYVFNTEVRVNNDILELVNSLWKKMVDILVTYFPMIMLFTTPLLTISLCFVQRKSNLPRINHYIFSLHYTAFVELLMLCIYVLYLVVAPPIGLLEPVMIICSCLYLTIAFRNVYQTNSWLKAVVKAMFTSAIYLLIGLMVFGTIFLIACFSIIGAS